VSPFSSQKHDFDEINRIDRQCINLRNDCDTKTASNQCTAIQRYQEPTAQNIDAIRSIVEAIMPTFQRVFESERDKYSASQQKEIEDRTVMVDVRETNLRIFKMVMNMQHNLPPQINRQQPVYFIDACGQHAPFHLEFINSWEAFKAVLEVRFKYKGPQKIRRGEYVLERASNKMALSREAPWEHSFQSGLTYTMDVMFDVPNQTTNCCPVCRLEAQESLEAEVDW
jgi:hypothetical protein